MGELSASGRRRVYRVLCYLARADADLSLREQGLLERLRERMGLSEEEAAALDAEAAQGEGLQLKASPEEAAFAVGALAMLMVADGVLHPDEATRLKRIGKALKVPPKALEKAVFRAIQGRGGYEDDADEDEAP